MRTRKVEWEPGRFVTAVTEGSGPPVLFAHGAGAGRTHPWMTGMASRLVGHGFAVTLFDYPYMEEGRKAPDRAPRLLQAHAAVRELVVTESGTPPFLVGKSMGGRMGSHLEVATPGLVFFGYPLVGAGKTVPRDTAHLTSSSTPMLFVQGERDPLAPLDLLRPVVDQIADAVLEVIPEADHSFRVPKRSGIDPEEMLDRLAAKAASWMTQAGAG